MELKRGGGLMSTKPNKEWIESVIKKAPVCDTSYEVMCADMLIHFGEAVECVKYKHLKINWHCEDNLVGEELPACTICKKGITYSGLPIHIARIFVAYCGWVKGKELNNRDLVPGSEYYESENILKCINDINFTILISGLPAIKPLIKISNICKAHKIDLAEAVEIVLSE